MNSNLEVSKLICIIINVDMKTDFFNDRGQGQYLACDDDNLILLT